MDGDASNNGAAALAGGNAGLGSSFAIGDPCGRMFPYGCGPNTPAFSAFSCLPY